MLIAPCPIIERGQFSIDWIQKKIPYRPGARWPIGARGTKGDWRLPMIHKIQYWDVLVKKIIEYPLDFLPPLNRARLTAAEVDKNQER